MSKKQFFKTYVGVRDETLAERLEQIAYKRQIPRGGIVIEKGEVVKEIPFLISGVVKAYYKDKKEREKIYCFGYLPGECVTAITDLGSGRMSVFALYTIEAIHDSELLCVPIEEMQRLASENEDCSRIYKLMLIRYLNRAVEYERATTLYVGKERYEWFQQTYPDLPEQVKKKDIASYLRMTPESLSRILCNVNKGKE